MRIPSFVSVLKNIYSILLVEVVVMARAVAFTKNRWASMKSIGISVPGQAAYTFSSPPRSYRPPPLLLIALGSEPLSYRLSCIAQYPPRDNTANRRG